MRPVEITPRFSHFRHEHDLGVTEGWSRLINGKRFNFLRYDWHLMTTMPPVLAVSARREIWPGYDECVHWYMREERDDVTR